MKQDTINANICFLAQQAHDAGAAAGTVLTYRTGDAPEPVSPVKLMSCTIIYAGKTTTYTDKTFSDTPLLGFRLNDELLGTARVDEVEPMRFATTLVMQKKGLQLVKSRWVNPDEPAGAKAIELGRCRWKELANNPEFLTSQGKEYLPMSSVGTTACGTVGSAKPDTLCIPIEGSEAFLPPLEPRSPAKKHKKSEEESMVSIEKIVYPTGVEEEGDFLGGQLHGAGMRKHPNGSIERGTFVHGRWQSPVHPTVDIKALKGTLFLPNGVIITGSFQLVEPPEVLVPETDAEEVEEVEEVAEVAEVAEEDVAGPSRPQRKRKAVQHYTPKGWTAGANNGHTAGRPIDPPDFSFDPTGRGDPVAQPRGVCNLPQMHGERNGGSAPRCSGYKRDDFVVSDEESEEESSDESSDESEEDKVAPKKQQQRKLRKLRK